LAFSEEDEQRAFNSKLKINNKRLARDILYDDSAQSMKLVPKNDEERKAKEQREKEIIEKSKNTGDLKENYNIDVDELQTYESEIQLPNIDVSEIAKKRIAKNNIHRGTPSLKHEPIADAENKILSINQSRRKELMSVSSGYDLN